MKERPRPRPADDAPPLAERDDVHLTANRCPFCREDVTAEAQDGVVCSQCLTRHHAACWSEAGRCSSCGNEVQLRRAPSATPPRSVVPKLVAVVLGTLVLLGLVGLKAYTDRQAARRASIVAEAEAARFRAKAEHAERLAAENERAIQETKRALNIARAKEAHEDARRQAEFDRAQRERKLRAEQAYQRELERARKASSARETDAETKAKRAEAERKILDAYSAEGRERALREEIDKRLSRATAFFEAKNFRDCLSEAQRLLALDANSAEGWILRGQAHEHLQEFAPALAAYERATRCPISPERLTEVLQLIDALSAATEQSPRTKEAEGR